MDFGHYLRPNSNDAAVLTVDPPQWHQWHNVCAQIRNKVLRYLVQRSWLEMTPEDVEEAGDE